MSQLIKILALALLGFTGTAQAVIPASERAVLIDLYNRTNGANWTNNTGWLGEPGTECSWFGVGCFFDNQEQEHVTHIHLGYSDSGDGVHTGNNLVGSLPESLSGLTALQFFVVYNNQLTGTIPSLSGLTALQFFGAWRDSSTGVGGLTGTIPSLSGLTALQSFDVGGNQLTGTIPSLSGLTALQYFHVGGNQLTGTIPSLSGLSALQSFGVDNNQLTGSIPSLSGLTALRYFGVGGNQLTGTIPSLSGLTALQSFFVYNNQLTGSIPSLSGLTALQYFQAYINQLTGSIPSLSGLTALQAFGVQNNQLTGPVPAAPSSLLAGKGYLCTNSLTSSGDPSIDAAWDTATGVDWLACQSGASVPVISTNLTSSSVISGNATLISKTAITGSAPLTVGFSATASSSNANDVLTYTWSFGDEQTGTGATAQHTYSSTGTYTASLLVDNGKGQSASPSETVTVTITGPTTPTCIAPEILQNGICVIPTPVCVAPQVLQNNVCVTPTPTCVAPQVLQNNVCVTPAPVCVAPQVLQNNVCVTPTPVCDATETLQGNVCVPNAPVCDATETLQGNVCVPNAPVCDATETLQGNVCVPNAPVCSATETLQGNVCVPITPSCTLTADKDKVAVDTVSRLTVSCSPVSSTTTYEWTGGTCAGNTSAICEVAASETTSYSVIASNGEAKSNPVNATVTVIVKPICTLSASSTAIKAGEPLTLTANCGLEVENYSWSGEGCAGNTTATCTVNPMVTEKEALIEYAVTANNISGASNNATAAVTVLPVCDAPKVLDGGVCVTPRYTLTVIKLGTGAVLSDDLSKSINCGEKCSHTYNLNESVLLTAYPATLGTVFDGWTGACTGTAPCPVTVDTTKTLTALNEVWVQANFKRALFSVKKITGDGNDVFMSLITKAEAPITATVYFNPADKGKVGAVFVTALVPADFLQHDGKTNLVLAQLTSIGWQRIVDDQFIPYATGELNEDFPQLPILTATDSKNLIGSQFCVGYGTSAAEMISTKRMQLVASLADPNATNTNTRTCNITLPVPDATVFAYAEANYPSLFTGKVESGQYEQYNYRYYSESGTYLGVDTAGNISLLGPNTNNQIIPVGSVESFRKVITDWESAQSR